MKDKQKVFFYKKLDRLFHNLSVYMTYMPGDLCHGIKGKLFSFFAKQSFKFGYYAYKIEIVMYGENFRHQ